MSTIALELVILLLLVAVNGLFAMSEIAVVSARKARLQQRADAGDGKARAALDLAEEPTRFLSTVQIGITLVGILAGAFGGATLTEKLAGALRNVPLIAPYREVVAVAGVVLAITFLSLVFGELIPKWIGLNNSEGIAALVAGPMTTLSRAAAPAVWLMTIVTEAVLRLVNVRPSGEPPVTEDEIRILLAQGTAAGIFQPVEQDVVERVLRLDDWRSGQLVTPRTEIDWINADVALEDQWATVVASRHSRFPVFQGTHDPVIGLVSLKDLWKRGAPAVPVSVTAVMRKPLFVPGTMPALRLLERFKASGQHLAFVVDEYGGVEGLVTVTDILEAIVGDIPAADDGDDREAVQREDGSWLIDGLMSAIDLSDLLDIPDLRPGVSGEFHTIGGFLTAHLGHLPSPGEHVFRNGWRLEVVDMDGNRVDKVLASRQLSQADEISPA
jgi:putative hemolysin